MNNNSTPVCITVCFKRVDITLIVVIVLFLCTDLVSSACRQGRKPSPVFETHPNDVNIVEGENATFACTVLGFDPNNETLTWHVFPDNYHTDIFDIYDESLQNKTSVITVYDVKRTEQTFQCILRGLYHGHIFETCHSKVSTMNVQYFPKNSEINCSSNSTEDIYDGSLLAIWCMVEKGNPSVNLSYETNELNLSVAESHLVLEGDILILRKKIYISPSLHFKTLDCVASGTSGIFQGEEIACTIGPFVVRHKPQVRIYSSQVLNSFDVAFKEIELNCMASSYPEKKVYKWLCFPYDSLTGCHNVTSQTILLGTKENDTLISNIYFEVNCSVTNAEGTTIGVFNFFPSLNPNASKVGASDVPTANPKIDDTKICTKIPPNLKVLNKSVDWDMRLFEVHVICISNCSILAGMNVLTFWAVNGMSIEHGSNNTIQPISPVTSSLKLTGNFKDHEVLVVTCEILSQNVTFSNDINVSFTKPVTGHVAKQVIAGSLTTEELQKKSNPIQFQSEISTTALQTEKGQSKINQDISFNLSDVQVIIFTAVAVLVGLLLIACICAFCTLCLFKYFEKLNLINKHRGNDQKSCTNSGSSLASRKIHSIDENLDKRISYEESMYEKPITPPSHPRALNASCKTIPRRECIFESEKSPNSIISYHCSDSITSSICSTSSNNISTTSEYYEWGGQTPQQKDGLHLGINACPSAKPIYGNDRMIKMDIFQKSVSLDRSHKFENLNEKQYPLPVIPS